MSQGVLFAFGSVIFFIVLTGAFMFGLQCAKEWAEKSG